MPNVIEWSRNADLAMFFLIGYWICATDKKPLSWWGRIIAALWVFTLLCVANRVSCVPK